MLMESRQEAYIARAHAFLLLQTDLYPNYSVKEGNNLFLRAHSAKSSEITIP